jgi:hypothetical protein
MLANPKSNEWDALHWRRRIETFGSDDGPSIAKGPKGEVDAIWYFARKIWNLVLTYLLANLEN